MDFDPDTAMPYTAAAGALVGLVVGFIHAGVGGAILGAIIGAIVIGALLAMIWEMIPSAVLVLVVAVPLVGIIWLISALWGVGN